MCSLRYRVLYSTVVYRLLSHKSYNIYIAAILNSELAKTPSWLDRH